MKAFISHETALAYWRLHFPLDSELGCPARVSKAQEHACKKADVLACVPEMYREEGKPIDILVPGAESRRISQSIRCHLRTGAVPKGAFYREGDMLVSSPEYLFLQMASGLTVSQLVALGCELCGAYVLLPQGVRHPAALDDFPKRLYPLTNTAKLQAFADAAEGVKGRTKALRALRFVVDGSRSPMETMTYMLLCLSPLLGGYGLPKPEMNASIPLDEEARTIAHRTTCEGDLCWRDGKLDIEYHGEVHVGSVKMKDDVGRTRGIEAMDWHVMTLTSQQVFDQEEFEVVVKDAAKRIKHRLYPRVLEAAPARTQLREELEEWMFLEG